MKKIIFALIFAVAMVGTAWGQAPAVGSPAPEFSLPDAEGKPVALSSLKGKWVVLDFWGSWCGWCIKGFPELKKAYADLGAGKGNVEFIGIAWDKKEAWLKAIDEHELPWVNVWANPETQRGLLEAYGVQGFPTKLVINPEGKIANITVGEDPAFYPALRELVAQ